MGLLMPKLLEIGETMCISVSRPPRIHDHFTLFRQYVTDLHVPETGDRPRVDSFNLLYSMLREIHCLPERRQISAEIGEGYNFVGHRDDERCWVTIGFGAKIGTREFTITEYLGVLTTIVDELSTSIRNAGIDIEDLMKKFPPI